ncbi:MAG: transglutaminase-like domain-containing protein [Eubacterium sp.]|nr:transglutaminase-like domain-containing protein [Eubacterium sp.]
MKVIKGIGIVIISLASVAALVLIIINMCMMGTEAGKMNSFIDREDDRYAEAQKKEDDFIEDGAVISGIYTIKSTKEISDAYINGQDPSGLSEEDKKTYDLAVKVLDEATKGKDTIYEKELAIFEWMAKNITHMSNSSTRAVLMDEIYPLDTPYGVLSSKNAVCVGCATTFRLLMNMLGLDCHIPHTDSHSWNEVHLDDNEWYLVDVYMAMDATTLPKYEYFNMNEVVGEGDFDLSMMNNLPRANGKKYLYPIQTAEDVEDIYQVPEKLKKALKDKKCSISLRFTKTPTEAVVNMALELTEAMRMRMSENMPEYESTSLGSSWCRDENDKYILSIYLGWTESGNNNVDPKSKEAKKLKKIMDKLFGKTMGYDPFNPESDATMAEPSVQSNNEAA